MDSHDRRRLGGKAVKDAIEYQFLLTVFILIGVPILVFCIGMKFAGVP